MTKIEKVIIVLCYGKDCRPGFSDGKMILMQSSFFQENSVENARHSDCRVDVTAASIC